MLSPYMDARFRGYDGPNSAALASGGAFFVHSRQRKDPAVLDLDSDGDSKSRNSVVINPRAPECQRETSVVLTTPLMRSDAQQAHCFRF